MEALSALTHQEIQIVKALRNKAYKRIEVFKDQERLTRYVVTEEVQEPSGADINSLASEHPYQTIRASVQNMRTRSVIREISFSLEGENPK